MASHLDPPTEFEYKGQNYQIKRIDAIGQAMLAQKLAPLVVPVMRIIASRAIAKAQSAPANPDTDEKTGFTIDDIMEMVYGFEAIALAIDKVPADSMREIYDVCLSRLSRERGKNKGWQVLWANGQLVYADIDGFDVISLSVRVIQDQLGNFINELLSTFGLEFRR